MFDKFNIFYKGKEEIDKKEKSIKSEILSEIFSNKSELAILTFSIYLFWVLYQILKLTWWFTTQLKLWNLLFFSFSNSINDFLIIFWFSLICFFLTFFVVFIINFIINFIFSFINFDNNKIIWYIILFITFWVIFLIAFYWNYNLEKFTYIIIGVPYLFSLILVAILTIHKKELTKKIFYIFVFLFLIYGFLLNLYWWTKYYWCEKIRDNNSEKDCFLLEYKNDKYWFTWNWDIYKLSEFKSFFTTEYIKNIKSE